MPRPALQQRVERGSISAKLGAGVTSFVKPLRNKTGQLRLLKHPRQRTLHALRLRNPFEAIVPIGVTQKILPKSGFPQPGCAS
jgi:hypothetical protein